MGLLRRFASMNLSPQSLLFQSTTSALAVLSSLPKDKLVKCVDVFRDHIFPPDKRSLAPSALAPILSDLRPKDAIRAISMTNWTHKEAIVQEALETLYEFLDKSNIGFLSGDLSSDLVESFVEHADAFSNGHTRHIAALLANVEQYLKKEEFCLPRYGIKYLEYENPQALFIRETLIEKETPSVFFPALDATKEAFAHESLGAKFMSPRKNLYTLYGDMSTILRHEIKLIRRQATEGSHLPYGTSLVRAM